MQIAQATIRHVQSLIPCRRVSVAVLDTVRRSGQIIALHDEEPTDVQEGAVIPLETFGPLEDLRAGIVRNVASDEHDSG